MIHITEPAACITDSWAQGAVPVVSSLKLIKSADTEITAACTTPNDSIDDSYVIDKMELKNTEKNFTEKGTFFYFILLTVYLTLITEKVTKFVLIKINTIDMIVKVGWTRFWI